MGARKSYKIEKGSIGEAFHNSRDKIQVFAGGFGNGKTAAMCIKGLNFARSLPLTPTFEEAIAHNYKAYRNRKEQTGTQWSLFDDAETAVEQKATVSDAAGTMRKTEIVAGP